MNKYVKFIIMAALLVCGTNIIQADSSPKTNKISQVNSKENASKKTKPPHVRKKYAAAAKRIKDGLKTGKITPQQAKDRHTAIRKRMMLYRFDKNKDGKLCKAEKAAMKKALAERKSKDTRSGKWKRGNPDRRERDERPRRRGDRKNRPARK